LSRERGVSILYAVSHATWVRRARALPRKRARPARMHGGGGTRHVTERTEDQAEVHDKDAHRDCVELDPEEHAQRHELELDHLLRVITDETASQKRR
jgi:hypothetical protein